MLGRVSGRARRSGVPSGMCSLGHTDFDLSTVGHNGLTVQGVTAAGMRPSAPWENITQWKVEAKNVHFFVRREALSAQSCKMES